MAMSFRQLHGMIDKDDYSWEIELRRQAEEAIEREKNRKKSIQEKVYDLEEFMIIEDNSNVDKFKPQNFKNDEEWENYYEYLKHQCKLNNLKQHLKIINRTCEDCGKKLKYCTCKCNDCGEIGTLNCDCLPF